jgi:enoyl-CoA hydratase/carnithine racemase
MGGSSYLLSRLPFEIGVYLALTGKSLGQADLYSLGFANSKVLIDQDFVSNVQGRLEAMPKFLDFKHYQFSSGGMGSELGYLSKGLFGEQQHMEVYDRIRENENPKKV